MVLKMVVVLERLLTISMEQVLEESLPTAPMESQVSVTVMIPLLECVS